METSVKYNDTVDNGENCDNNDNDNNIDKKK